MVQEDYVNEEIMGLLFEKDYWQDRSAYYTHYVPTQSQVMKWLREEKKIGIEANIIFDFDDDHKWYFEYGFCIFQLSGTYKKIAECDYDGYKTYEEACEAAIKYCLENLI